MEKILTVENLSVVHLENGVIKRELVRAVNLNVYKGIICAVVGESGSGKSLTAFSIINLMPSENLKISRGKVFFDGKNLLELDKEEIRKLRGKEIFLIPQDPLSALNPVLTIEEQISELFYYHTSLNKKEIRERAVNLLYQVGIDNPEKRLKSYPHQLSGGQRQRVLIAMSLALNPKLIIADEPTTAIDVSLQKGILDTFIKLRDSFGISFIIITHDFGVVKYVSDYVYVMYGGKVVEEGKKEIIFKNPFHPYTKGLINSVPSIKVEPKSLLSSIKGTAEISDYVCPFYERCDEKEELCKTEVVYLKAEEEHFVLCRKIKY